MKLLMKDDDFWPLFLARLREVDDSVRDREQVELKATGQRKKKCS